MERRMIYQVCFSTAACPGLVQEEYVVAYNVDQAKQIIEKEYGYLIVCNIYFVRYAD